MFTRSQKKEFLRNGIYIFFILLLAVVSTYYIYYKFQGDRNIDFNSKSLDVTYREKTGDKISLTKVTPVTDSVGLSSTAYLISIQNNLTEKVDYKIRIVPDLSYVIEDVENDHTIPMEDIRISVKAGKMANQIYTLSELEEGVLLEDTMQALEEKNISIRLWIKHDSTLPSNKNLSYHGIIQVIEDGYSIASTR